MRSRSLLAATLVAFLAACGARTTLRSSSEGATGTGGSGPGTTGTGGVGAGTSSSTGGSVDVVCPALALRETVEVPMVYGVTAAHDPLLQSLGQSGVLALARRERLEPPGSEPSSILQSRFDPWESWPPKPQQAVSISDTSANTPFVAGVEPLGTFAVGVAPYPHNAPTGCQPAAIYGITPGALLPPDALSLSFMTNCDEAPVSVASAGNGAHIIALDAAFNFNGMIATHRLSVNIVDASGTSGGEVENDCASTPLVGDVLADETGFLLARSSSEGGSCSFGPPFDPARRLVLERVDLVDGASKISVLHEGMDDLVYARLLPRPGGAWALYRESGASALIQPPGMALRLVVGTPSEEAFTVTPPGIDRMASAAFGDGFVVAFVDSSDPSAPKIFVRVFDGSGTMVSEAAFATNEAGLQGDRLTLVGSPDARSFLVGWAGAKAAPGAEMFLRRFDCIAHE